MNSKPTPIKVGRACPQAAANSPMKVGRVCPQPAAKAQNWPIVSYSDFGFRPSFGFRTSAFGLLLAPVGQRAREKSCSSFLSKPRPSNHL